MAKKTTSKSAGSKKDELLKIIKDLDEKGISLLIEQANTYKKSMAKIPVKDESTKGATVNIIPDAKMTSFVIQIGNIRKVFTRDAFREVVKACHSAKAVSDAAKNLYTLLLKDKKDFLTDNNIKKSVDPKLISLINSVKSKYKPKA
jgi:hypothetical protein